MTYLDLQNAVYDALIDGPTIVKNAVPRLINQAIRELEDKFKFKDMESSASYVTTTSSHTLSPSTMPSDFKSYRGKPFYIENLGGTREISIAPNRQMVMRKWYANDIGAPRNWLWDGTANPIEIWPLSDNVSDYTDGQYRITLPYWKYLPDLANPTDTNWFTLNTQQYIINWTVARAFMIDWDEKRAQFWKGEAEDQERKAIRAGKLRYLTETGSLIPLQGAFDAPMEDY